MNNLSHEERLHKVWRTMASGVVGSFQKAEKAAAETTKGNCKELDEAVVNFLRYRMEWHRLITHVEFKLQGKAQEMEALECHVRTQPRLGKRKRQQEDVNIEVLQLSAVQNVPLTDSGTAPAEAPAPMGNLPPVEVATTSTPPPLL